MYVPNWKRCEILGRKVIKTGSLLQQLVKKGQTRKAGKIQEKEQTVHLFPFSSLQLYSWCFEGRYKC